MPLSDEEQRILSQIERQFYENDPALAEQMATTTVYTDSLRRIKWAILLFVAGFAAILASLAFSIALAAIGFLVMLGSSLMLEHHIRKVGRTGLADLTGRMRRSRPASDRQSLRDRLRRPHDE